MQIAFSLNAILFCCGIVYSSDASNIPNGQYPQRFGYMEYNEMLLDFGKTWESNSLFKPMRISTPSENDVYPFWIGQKVHQYGRSWTKLARNNGDDLGLIFIPAVTFVQPIGPNRKYGNGATQINLWGEAWIKDNWYSRFSARFTNEANSMTGYSGLTRDIARAGFSTGEVDEVIIGYTSRFVTAEWGRNREIWGPLPQENLILTQHTPAWEQISLRFDYKRLTYKWFFGFLEVRKDEDDNAIQRYITGKMLQYTNRENLVLGIGELSMLSGKDRPLELAMFNPISLHVEVEQNKRHNVTSNNSDALWFIHFDYLASKSMRITGSILADEYQIDKEDREGAASSFGWLGRVAYSTTLGRDWGQTVTFRYVRLNTLTTQHQYAYSNFVSRNMHLAHPIGNDADLTAIGYRLIMPFSATMSIDFGSRRWGDNNLAFKSNKYIEYDGFKWTKFPSGEVRKNTFVSVQLEYEARSNLNLWIKGHKDLKTEGSKSGLEFWEIGLSVYPHYYFNKL